MKEKSIKKMIDEAKEQNMNLLDYARKLRDEKKEEYLRILSESGEKIQPEPIMEVSSRYKGSDKETIGKRLLDRWTGFVGRPAITSNNKTYACICGKPHNVRKSSKLSLYCPTLDLRVFGRTKMKLLNNWVVSQVSILDQLEKKLEKIIDKTVG